MSSIVRGRVLWAALLAIYVFAVIAGITGWNAGPQFGFSAEFNSEGQAVVNGVLPGSAAWSAGLRSGDMITSIDGRKLSGTPSTAVADYGLSLSAIDDSTGETISWSRDANAIPSAGLAAALILVSFCFFVVSALVELRASRNVLIYRFSILSMVAAIALAVAPGSLISSHAAFILQGYAIHWLPVAFVAFFVVFGQETPPSGMARRYAPVVAVAAVAIALDTFRTLSLFGMPVMTDLIRTVGLLFLAAGLLGGNVLLAWRLIVSKTERNREQIRIVLVGTALAVLPFAVFSLVPLTLAPNLALDPEFTVLGAILIPLSFAYAIFRHQLLGIRTMVHRGVVYALLSALIVTAYSVVVVIIRSVNGGGDVSPATEGALLVVMAAGVPLVPGARRGAGAVVDKILYPERPDHANLARDISREIAVAASVGDLLRQTLTGLRTGLRLTYAQAIKFSNGDPPETVSVGEGPSIPERQINQFRQALRESNEAKLLEGEGIDGSVLAGMATGRSETSVLIFLGPRISDEPFNSDDIRLMETVSGVLTTALNRLQLIEELQQQADELRNTNRMLLQLQEAERSEVAGFIHDAPLQRVSHVLAEARHAGLHRELVGELETAMQELRNLSSTLSPSMLENLGLMRSLESLAKETEDSAGMRVLFSYGGAGRDTRFRPEEELAAFRIAQEALTNCRKHSRASTVWMTLEVLPDSFTITIEDNGKGLPPADLPQSSGTFGIGMRSMRARAEQLGGSMAVSSSEPHGVRVLAEIPRAQVEEIAVEAAAS